MIQVTNHAQKRFKQRLGLPKKACQRHAEIAFQNGFKHADARGNAKKYLDRLFLEHRTATNMRIYGDVVYIFNHETLITVFGLPKNVRSGFKSND